jgi:predicted DNA binding CopG/RHH family protein
MSKKKDARTAVASTPTRTPHQDLAQEASDWDSRRRTPAGFVEEPSAVPRAQEATAISIRMPNALLVLLKKFAEREGIGYQVLIKRWLDDRVRVERDRMRANRADLRLSAERSRAPQFPLIDRDDDRGHYQHG